MNDFFFSYSSVSSVEIAFNMKAGYCNSKTIGFTEYTLHECARLCQNDLKCHAFSYNFNSESEEPLCQRKQSACLNFKPSSDFFTFSRKSFVKYYLDKDKLFYVLKGDCFGNDLPQNYLSSSVDFCASND